MGALTSANLDQILVNRTGRKLAYADLDSVTADGTNGSLADGRVEGFRSLGLIPISPMNLVDADLLAVADGQLPQLVDVAELRTLENILGNKADVDQTTDTDNMQAHGKFYDSLEKTVARKRLQCERQYSYGLSTLTPGVIDLGFQETIDVATGRPI